MPNRFAEGVSARRQLRPGLITLLYVVVGWIWILAGSWGVDRFTSAESRVIGLELLKGALFVALTGASLYVAMRVWGRHLEENRRTLEMVLGQIPGLFWTTDRSLSLQWVAGAAPLGLADRSNALTGLRITALAQSEDEREVIEAAHLQALRGQSADLEMELGSQHFVVRLEPLESAGRIVGVLGLGLRASRYGALSEGAAGVRQTLKRGQVLATAGALVLEVSHRMMNPLFAMSSALDALEARLGDDARTQPHRKLLRQQIERVTELVGGLRDFGQLGAVEVDSHDVGLLLRRVEDRWREHATSLGVDLEIEGPEPGAMTAKIDAMALERAIGNLVQNSCRHTPPGNRVLLRALVDEEGESSLVLRVEDEGDGFFAEDLESAKDPLVARHAMNAGLGLAIAERVAHLHGGTLTLEPGPSGGAVVILEVPRIL